MFIRGLEYLLRSPWFITCSVSLPFFWPVVAYVQGAPGMLADPGKYLLHHLGFVAVVLLAITLALTPLRLVTGGQKWTLALNRHRRLLGVSAFVYALLHVIVHILYEGGVATFWADVQRPFLVTGMIAFVILAVLAATSFNRIIRWLGAARWKNLHRLVYVAAALLIYHQAAARKLFPMQVVWIFAPLLVLEIGRLVLAARAQAKTRSG